MALKVLDIDCGAQTSEFLIRQVQDGVKLLSTAGGDVAGLGHALRLSLPCKGKPTAFQVGKNGLAASINARFISLEEQV